MKEGLVVYMLLCWRKMIASLNYMLALAQLQEVALRQWHVKFWTRVDGTETRIIHSPIVSDASICSSEV